MLLSHFRRGVGRRSLFVSFREFSKERAGKSVKPGATLVIDEMPHRVTKIIQGKRGKGGGFVRATLKNMESSNSFEKTFTSDEMVEHAHLERQHVQYSWTDGNEFVFMDVTSFEELRVNEDDVLATILRFKDRVIGVELPIVNEYTVASVDGDRATLESGAVITVPGFIEKGTRIRVNTVEGTYIDRA